MNKDEYIGTYTGRRVHIFNPSADEIHILDIATALSRICRFNGHCRQFYSVAEHSILASLLFPPGINAKAALFHDAGEAYLGDIVRPIKRQLEMKFYRKAEGNLYRLIAKIFGLPEEIPAAVHQADNDMLFTELATITPDADLQSPRLKNYRLLPILFHHWTPEEAKEEFLKRYQQLFSQESLL
ncbi:hypothetical protein A2415_03100 [candidate division WWE3 bacterium RIFOXYC1_FULL_39_7]|uniref:Phosphohydrolase n=2 Tax=Katanobacteria TaxID=422282 RepID=A0A1F4X8K0_UNCKA|nr:MAG: hypothetical protein A2415_03100 [candidate division WWE3 bacterium RIFOXYC1_FULL_39_7]OGC78017.1 MAG: hypothetical protein A2619_02950 [candidate division WWE3 bacterium RIFOXYD1_FULL_39_9]